MEKLIERLIEQYIDEIEKIAAVVTNAEVNEFTEELEPFEVGMTEMLTVPVTTLGGGEKVTSIGRSVKDWFAEKASNMLINKANQVICIIPPFLSDIPRRIRRFFISGVRRF